MLTLFTSVRSRLMGLVLVSLTPALALVVYSDLEQRELAIRKATESAHGYIDRIGRDQVRIFERAEQLLNVISVVPPVREFRREVCSDLLSTLVSQYHSYISLTVFDRQGDLQCSGPPPERSFNIADRTHFRNAVQSNSVAIGDYVVSRLLGKPTVYVAHPLRGDAGQVIGTVNAGLDLQWLDLLVRNHGLQYDAELTLFDRSGTVFASYAGSGDGTLRIGEKLPGFTGVDDLRSARAGSVTGPGASADTLEIVRPLSGDNFNAYLRIAMPMESVVADADAIFKRNLYLVTLVGMMVLVATWFLSDRSIVRFIDALISATRRLQAGDLSIRTHLPPGNSELHELAYDFDSMAQSLQRRDEEQMRIEKALRGLADGKHRGEHDRFMRRLLRDLAQILEMDFGFIALYGEERDRIETTFVYGDGEFHENFSYQLAGTPCQHVLDDSICVVPDDAHLVYADDAMLAEMGFRSYIGAVLRNAENQAFGVIAFLRRASLPHESLSRSLLPVVASRVGIEMDKERIERERQGLFEELKIAATAFESNEGMFITDADFRVLRVNEAFIGITGFLREEVMGKTPALFVADFDAALFKKTIREAGKHSLETVYRSQRRGSIHVAQSASAVLNDGGEIINFVFHIQNISERKEQEEKIKHMAYHDALTNLPNRMLLMDRLEQAIAVSRRRGSYGVLMYLDIDHFKNINDTLGHAFGDRLLVELSDRFPRILRAEDTFARLGGDEFVVLSPQLADDLDGAIDHAAAIADKLLHAAQEPFEIEQKVQHIGVSIGIAVFPEGEATAGDLLKKADMAMYEVKAEGRNSVRFFEAEMQRTLVRRTRLENELIRASQNSEFELRYQPKVDISGGRIVGCEALLRWMHPQHGIVMPMDFIPVLEETGMIRDLGQWVLREACLQMAEFRRRFGELESPLHMAVNVSPKQFQDAGFVDSVFAIIEETGIEPGCLEFEITEGLLMRDMEDATRKMERIKRLGVRFSIDDFGMGYSSLQYIKRLPIDSIKIDREFVRDCTSDLNDRAIVIAIIRMARSLGYGVVAEGVANQETLALLSEYECDAYQGLYYSPPVTPGRFVELLSQEARRQIAVVDRPADAGEG